MYKLALIFLLLFCPIATPASAAGASQDKWVVTQLSGDARVVHPGLQPSSLKVSSELAPGDTLLTGPTGRATLVRGGDYIVVAPRSELRLPSTPQPTGFTRVIQNLGTLLFKVQHTGIPHFAVDTPMLAAVVKGTTFTVVVDQQRSAVQVIQGVVQVTALDGGMNRMVEGGRTVFVNHSAPKVLLDADKPVPAPATPSSTRVTVSAAGETPLASIGTLTGGLVRADLSAPQAATAAPTVQTVLTATTPSQSATPGATTSSPAATTVTTTVATAPSTTAAVPPSTSATPAVTVGATTVTVGTTTATPVVTVATTTPSATAPSVSVGPVTTPTVTAPSVVVSTTTPNVTVPSTTTPTITTSVATIPSVTAPTVTIPSLSVGSSSGSGSLNSGSGSLSSGSGSLNSGPGSLSSGSGSGSSPTIASVSTPSVTVPSTTTPVVPIATPTVTVPSISTPTITVPAPLLKF